jgi:NADH:ubiquinone oxidoreductase subunit 6 (subunit J)
MTLPFIIFAILMLASAIAAISLRNLVHCALAVALTFLALAALYLQLDAQFVGFAQVLVYVGAVAILVVFAILLTQGKESWQSIFCPSWIVGISIGAGVFGVLDGMVMSSRMLPRQPVPAPDVTVRQIGDALMTKYILPLEVIGLLLTAALIGAVIIALRDDGEKTNSDEGKPS